MFRWLDGGKGRLDDQAEKLVSRVAAEVLADTVARCPVDTGTLAGSYSVGRMEKRGNSLETTVGTTVEYAPFVEFGTRHTRAQPHLGPAVERARRRYG